MPWLLLMNGPEKIYIFCNQLPPPGGVGPLEIGTCRRDGNGQDEFLAFECLRNPPQHE